jgi:hypothetical protein
LASLELRLVHRARDEPPVHRVRYPFEIERLARVHSFGHDLADVSAEDIFFASVVTQINSFLSGA